MVGTRGHPIRSDAQRCFAGSRAPGYDFWVRRARVILLVGIGLALGVGLAYADIYGWTDNEGVQHFTNIKPHGGQWKKVMDAEAPMGSKASAQRGSCPRCDKVAATDTS